VKTVREWLQDYFVTIEGTQMETVLADVASREADSFNAARWKVDGRIDAWITWLNGTRPAPDPTEVRSEERLPS
jgi:accessory colonization factor AcfC